MAARLAALLSCLSPAHAIMRERFSLDASWLFLSGEAPGYSGCSANASFPLALDGVEGSGLQPMGVVADEDACMALCCASFSCQLYNFCPAGSVGGCSGSAPSTCWIGSLGGVLQNNTKWVGRGRWAMLPPPPSRTGPQTLAYEDAAWRGLSLPHDYVVEGQYQNITSLRDHGFLSSGVAWYRRHLVLNASLQGQALWLDVDGAYRGADVWLNGAFLGHHESGYTSFRFYLHNATDPFTGAPAIRWGEDNVLAFRVDGRDFEGWWYEGSGLYRHVWLTHASPTFIVPWSIYAPAFVLGDVSAPQGPTGAVFSPAGATLHASADVYSDAALGAAAVNASLPLGYLQWAVVYAPGNATAVCRDEGGGVVGVGATVSAGAPASLRLAIDAGSEGIAGDGTDVALLSVSVHDAAGTLVPAGSSTRVTFSVTGDGALYGLGNGDPASHEMDKNSSSRLAFGGLVRAIVRGADTQGRGGVVRVAVASPGLAGDALEVRVLAGPGVLRLP